MSDNSSSNKTIAKNTIVLYVRMVIVMFLSLYTSRIVLEALGVEDFGLYGVVGGVVGLFAFFKRSMEKATQRFLNVEMVRGKRALQSVFSTSWTIHVCLAIIILLLAETIGLWFLNVKVNIPSDRVFAGNIVFQTTVVSLCLTMLEVPFSADIIAHENMSFFAVVSIFDALFKLVIAFCILNSGGDHLVLYGVLMMSITLVNCLLLILYCWKNFIEFSLRLSFERKRFKEIFSFVGWTFLGQVSVVGCNQGNTILVNMFHTVAANAAMSIGTQVSHAVTNLTSNFQTAFNPQITKSYAEGNFDYLRYLVFSTSKISYCLLFVVSLPICINIDYILDIWLVEVPKSSNVFCVLFLINCIINALSAPLNFSVLASGKVKWFQIVTSIVYLLDLVVLYVLFIFSFPPTTALWVKIGIMLTLLFVRLFFAHQEVPCIDLNSYLCQVLFPLLLMSGGSIIFSVVVLPFINTSLLFRIIFTIIVVLVNMFLIWRVALTGSQRKSILNIIYKKCH